MDWKTLRPDLEYHVKIGSIAQSSFKYRYSCAICDEEIETSIPLGTIEIKIFCDDCKEKLKEIMGKL